jgi:DNA-binding IclR family transcriptional regulator
MAPRKTSGPTVIAGYDSSEAVVCDLSVGTIVPLPRTATERAFRAHFARQTLWLPTQPAGMMSKMSMSRIWTIADVEVLIRQTQRNRPARTGDKMVAGLTAIAASTRASIRLTPRKPQSCFWTNSQTNGTRFRPAPSD